MIQHWLFALDRLFPLPAVERRGSVDGFTLYTSHRTIKLI